MATSAAMPVPRRYLWLVIVAAGAGTIIEWYDFYIFGSLATILSTHFFNAKDPVAALLNTIAIFTIGFLIRPLGALIFGWVGDRIGRKYTFLITLTGMGLSTALIGLVPSYATIGVVAPIIVFLLRVIQGLTLGGEYGGAIVYLAEHAPDERRGYYTGYLQTTPTIGLLVSLLVVIGTRLSLGNEAFTAWGWRIPFLISALLVIISFYIRLRLQETPIFQEIKAKGRTSRNPWKESFASANIKYVLIAAVIVLGEGVVWYSSQFWALYFLQTVQKLDTLASSTIVGWALFFGLPMFVLMGWLSDRIGRKPIILAGLALAAATYYPLYSALGRATPKDNINYPLASFIVWIMVVYVAMVYGPIAAFLAEFFPARIRYTSVSVPYHIGNGWGGGLVPLITADVWARTHNLGLTLAYTIAVPAIAFLLGLFIMPQTHRAQIWTEPAPSPAGGGSGDD
ncbi:MFS transporter [Thermorudis peleae]|uniref:MFS transporter n=1 Tax=Thermorudis peleae TaxID=1382356 RepID=UPI00057089C5|nr:MFS transporter [Thermorudis peleae]